MSSVSFEVHLINNHQKSFVTFHHSRKKTLDDSDTENDNSSAQ